jgi:lipopolysaccharide export system protein LptA
MSRASFYDSRRPHASSGGSGESLAPLSLPCYRGPASRSRATLTLLFAALTVPALLLSGNGATALPEDRLQAIEITAERAERNEREGYTVYSGAVILTQGSLRIDAERLTIFHDRVAADRIVAVGEPARLRQQPAIDREPVRASARRIVYEKSRELVLLRESASIEQDGAVVTGESIQYFMAEERVRADATADDERSRVQVFIPADVIEEAQREDDGRAAEPGGGDKAESDAADPADATSTGTMPDPAKKIPRGESQRP